MGGPDAARRGSARSASFPCASASTCCSTPARASSTACSPTHMDPVSRRRATSRPTAWSPASVEIDGRRVAVVRLRLHRDGRLDGRGRRAQDRAACASVALRQRIPIVWLLDSAGARIQATSRLDVRRRRAPVPRAGRDERRRADGRGDARPLRGRHRVHPRARRLRADGEGHVVDGARRPPPREGGGRRGRHRGGDGRLGGAHQDQRRRRPRGRRRRGVPRDRPRATSRSSRSTTRSSRPPVASRPIPSTGACEELYDIVPTAPRRAYDMRKVDHGDRRRRRLLLDEAGVGEEPRHRRSRASAVSRSASSPTSRWCSAARST